MSEFQSCVCPFCNSIDTRMGEHGDQHYVWCHACRASGPECDTEAEAIEMWDRPARRSAIFDEQNTLLRVKIKLYEDCRDD